MSTVYLVLNFGKTNYYAACYLVLSYYSYGNLAEPRLQRNRDIMVELVRLTIGMVSFSIFDVSWYTKIFIKSNLISIVILTVTAILSDSKQKIN